MDSHALLLTPPRALETPPRSSAFGNPFTPQPKALPPGGASSMVAPTSCRNGECIFSYLEPDV